MLLPQNLYMKLRSVKQEIPHYAQILQYASSRKRASAWECPCRPPRGVVAAARSAWRLCERAKSSAVPTEGRPFERRGSGCLTNHRAAIRQFPCKKQRGTRRPPHSAASPRRSREVPHSESLVASKIPCADSRMSGCCTWKAGYEPVGLGEHVKSFESAEKLTAVPEQPSTSVRVASRRNEWFAQDSVQL